MTKPFKTIKIDEKSYPEMIFDREFYPLLKQVFVLGYKTAYFLEKLERFQQLPRRKK